MTLTELCNLIGAHSTDCMNKAMYGRVARPLFNCSVSGLGTRLGDHNITVMLLSLVDAPLDGPYTNQVHVSVCIYFHWLLLL